MRYVKRKNYFVPEITLFFLIKSNSSLISKIGDFKNTNLKFSIPTFSQMDMKRHSLKVVNAICWAVSKCDRFDEIKPDLINLGERHRNYGLKLCYILVSRLHR